MVSEYDHEITSQSQTAEKPVASWDWFVYKGYNSSIATTITRHQEDNQSKSTSSLFPIEMIAKLVWTQSNAQQNIEHNGNNNQQRINNNRTPALGRTAAKATVGLKCILLVQIFALDSAVVEIKREYARIEES